MATEGYATNPATAAAAAIRTAAADQRRIENRRALARRTSSRNANAHKHRSMGRPPNRIRKISSAPGMLMRQAVDHVVDAELVRFVRGIEREDALPRPFPVLGNVVVVVGNHHQAL